MNVFKAFSIKAFSEFESHPLRHHFLDISYSYNSKAPPAKRQQNYVFWFEPSLLHILFITSSYSYPILELMTKCYLYVAGSSPLILDIPDP